MKTKTTYTTFDYDPKLDPAEMQRRIGVMLKLVDELEVALPGNHWRKYLLSWYEEIPVRHRQWWDYVAADITDLY
jgi:hypothetical protein